MKKRFVAVGVGLLATSLLSVSVDHKAEAAAYQVTDIKPHYIVAPGEKFQIQIMGHLPGGKDVQLNPAANGITFQFFNAYPQLNYITVDKNGVVTVSPKTKGGVRASIRINLPGKGVTSTTFLVEIPGQMSDISGSYAKDAIYRLVQMRAVSGVGDGTFHPHQVITHEEFATILERTTQDIYYPFVTPTVSNGWPDYLDNQNHKAWYYPYVENNEDIPPLVPANADRTHEVFGVGKPISRQDAIYAIMQTFLSQESYQIMHGLDPKQKINWNTFHPFTDLTKDSPYYESITAAKYYGIIAGYPDGKLHPNDPITREMAAQLLDKALQIFVKLNGAEIQVVYGYVPFLNNPSVKM